MAKISRRSRNRTENKRFGHKAARQETRRVLEQGVMPKITHGVHWAPTIEQPPLPDNARTGGPKPKKKRKPKERCPANGAHEWYHEEVQESETIGGHYSIWWPDRWVKTITNKWTIQTRTCIHCWKVQKRIRSDTGWNHRWGPWRPK